MARAIVVGVDGSDPSLEALQWAVTESHLQLRPLVAVHAWSFLPAQPMGHPAMQGLPVGDIGEVVSAEREAAQSALDFAVSTAIRPPFRDAIEQRVVENDARAALVAESTDAGLLVLGSTGHSYSKSMRLGSVCRHVLIHAACPVVVMPMRTGQLHGVR